MQLQMNMNQTDTRNFIDIAKENITFYGVNEASIQDLLAVIIGKKANLLVCCQLSTMSIRDLKAMTAKDFKLLEGISPSVAERLEAVVALSKRLAEQNLPESDVIRSPEEAYKALRFLRHEQQEQFVALFLDTKNKIIGRRNVFKGSLNASIVHPREVYHESIRRSAAGVIVGHQHPSGDPSPSREDIEVTKRLVECGKIIGIELLDHIIVGDNKYVSLKEKGYV